MRVKQHAAVFVQAGVARLVVLYRKVFVKYLVFIITQSLEPMYDIPEAMFGYLFLASCDPVWKLASYVVKRVRIV